MSEQFGFYISTYGYLAMFLFVYIQELGVPGPPNELVLFSIGMLGRYYGLEYAFMLLLVVVADTLGSLSVYFLFYYGKTWLLRIKPSWIRLPNGRLSRLKEKMTQNSYRVICIGKLTPFVRGYIPVAAGMLQVKAGVYAKSILFTAVVWSGGWITIGWFFGVYTLPA